MAQDDFDLASLATYLHLTPQKVAKLADRGKLPGRKVAGQWRFSQAEIHHWLEHRIGISDEEELVHVEGVLRRSAGCDEPEEVCIAERLPVEGVAVPLAARTRNSVITSMIDLAAGTGWLWDPPKMAEAVRSREAMYPTALENGVALLHARRPMASILEQGFVVLGITPTGIPFGGSRGVLTDVFFLLCSEDEREHLRTLARLSRLIGADDFLDRLRCAEAATEAHGLIATAEEELFG
ncbi:MAG: PTS sugar transporter subunit IIA [Planctomycetes bacterium]|nr:PTS sugar transporter subunit IIA [Planctomycetota bacterium]